MKREEFDKLVEKKTASWVCSSRKRRDRAPQKA